MNVATFLLIVGCLAGSTTQLSIIPEQIANLLDLGSLEQKLQDIVAAAVCKTNAIVSDSNDLVLCKDSLDVLRQTFHCADDKDCSTTVCAQINSNVRDVQLALVKEVKRFCKSLTKLSQSQSLGILDGVCPAGNILNLLNLGSLEQKLRDIVAKAVCKTDAIVSDSNDLVLCKDSLDVLRQTFHCADDKDCSTTVCAQINSNVHDVQLALVKELKQFCKQCSAGTILNLIDLGSLAQKVQQIVTKALCQTNKAITDGDGVLTEESLDVLRTAFHCTDCQDISTTVCAQINSNIPKVQLELVNEIKQFCSQTSQCASPLTTILNLLNLDSLEQKVQKILAKAVCKAGSVITDTDGVLTKESLDALRTAFHCADCQDTSTPVCTQINSNVRNVQLQLVRELNQLCTKVTNLSQSQVLGVIGIL